MTDSPSTPDPWLGFDESQACWSHHRNESITRRTFQVCFECGHVWTRWALWRSYIKAAGECGVGLRRWIKRPSRIYFCQVCIHDF